VSERVAAAEQLTLDDEVTDDLTWHDWFVSLPSTPTSTSTSTLSRSLPTTSTIVISIRRGETEKGGQG
jgi:hypothetical protein